MTDGQVIILIISATLFGMFFVAWVDELIVKSLRDLIKKESYKIQNDCDKRVKALKEEYEFKLNLYKN